MERMRCFHRIVKHLISNALTCIFKWSSVVVNILKECIKSIAYKVHQLGVDIGRETGILAISLMANRNLHYLERYFWLFVVVLSTCGAIMLSSLQIRRYYLSPTVISLDRDYRGWTGPLPAVTLCYYDQIDSFLANEYIQEYFNVSVVDEEFFYFMDFIYAVVNATASNYLSLAGFAEDERLENVNLYDLILSIGRSYDQVVTSFDTEFAVSAMPVMTERGLCYAVNAPMSEMLSEKPIDDIKNLQEPLKCEYGKQQCFIKMDLYESTGSIHVHSPYEVTATDASVISLHKSDEILSTYKIIETVASKNLRELSFEQRKCVFHDEETSNLKIYSRSLCLVRCRAVMALEMCNCVPFFYSFVEGPPCSPAGFECLFDFKWPIWALHICKCPSTCTEIEYSVQTNKKSSWGFIDIEEGLKTDVATSSFRWDLIPPKVRYRRDVVFSFEDLLVSFGGVMALFLGISLMSVIQLGYVLTFRLLESLYNLFYGLYKRYRLILQYLSIYQYRRKMMAVRPLNGVPLQKNILKIIDQTIENDHLAGDNDDESNDDNTTAIAPAAAAAADNNDDDDEEDDNESIEISNSNTITATAVFEYVN